ncbi:PREDICTED: myb-related transcription factor, partner of profilin [Rhagoletis zephyria]|uniref:myb-related transcription factor, partner of profilin n=1 Tax=Rhagoletis zephyria TaxID=28612 RepID=UPI0008116F66|nr:PREDICTED: myb-related transcription factor, partner of profilin [Rhagoletis zephyria]
MHLPESPLLLLMLLWRILQCASESTITHASNVSKRQLQFGESFVSPGYQLNNVPDNHETNVFMQSTRLLYDPGYNAQDSHELTSRSANSAVAAMMNSQNGEQQYQQRTPEARKFDDMSNAGLGVNFAAPQTFSHIYFPQVYSPSSQHGPGRTAPHVFPGDTPATMAARSNGQSYSTSSTYFVPMSVLYHPNVGPHQHQPHIHPHRQLQELRQQQQQRQQQTQAYNSLPPPLPPLPPPPPPSPPPPPPTQYQQYQQQPSPEQQQSTSQQSVYQRHSQQQPAIQNTLPPPLPPLPRLPPLPQGQHASPPPQPLNFQAPFRASQFLGYMHDQTHGSMPQIGANERAPLYTEAYPMMGAAPLQQPLVKPIYERMRENFMNDATQQNYAGAATQHARYGRYIYMAPSNLYALFKAA